MKKKIVYLFGTGATQAEITLFDDNIKILMYDIKDSMATKLQEEKNEKFDFLINEVLNKNADIEQLISLYESSGSYLNYQIAKKLKKLFREAIQSRIKKLGRSFKPKLISALVDMYEIPNLEEELIAILTLNYEDITELAIKAVKGNINYYIDVNNRSRIFKFDNQKDSTFPILKLHGSFNWKDEFPVAITRKVQRPEEDILWIPPGVDKNKDKYPFSLLWGKAREILDCDVLRVIGCSLNRNDWGLIKLLYSTQKLNSKRKPYNIEIINYDDVGYRLQEKDYPYLNIQTISEIKEVQKYFKKSYSLSDEKLVDSIKLLLHSNQLKSNIFDIWLRAQGEELIDNNVKIETKSGIFKNYIEGA